MTICKRCVLPDTVPGITFDDDGVCNQCRSFKEFTYYGHDALEKLADEAREKERQYDCVVPLSGGRDSSYVLYLAKVELGLNVLAVNYDNEFITEAAYANMRNACKALEIDLVSIRSKKNLASKVVYHNIFCSDLSRLLGVCRACTYGHRAVVYKVTSDKKIPLILWGNSKQEETKGMLQKAKKLLRKQQSRMPRFFNPHYYAYEWYFLLLRLELPMPGHFVPTRSTKFSSTDIAEVSVFDYIPWDREMIKKTITGKLGWVKPQDSISTWRTDCLLSTVVSHCFYKTYGCTKHCFGHSRMINDGSKAREDALREEEAMIGDVLKGDQMRRLLKETIGLSDAETQKVMSSD